MLLAKDVMSRDVITVSPTTPVEAMTRLVLEHQLDAIPVVNETGSPLGVVTQEHLITRWAVPIHKLSRLSTEDPLHVLEEAREEMTRAVGKTAAEEMQTDMPIVPEDVPVSDLVGIFLDRHVPAVLVVRENRLVGIVAKWDILKAMGGAGDSLP